MCYSRGMREINLTTTHGGKPGWCTGCGKPFANLANHAPYCLEIDHDAEAAKDQSFIDRAAAHATAIPRAEQRWQHAVTDQDVALVMYAIERMAVDIYLNRAGQWVGWRVGTGIRLNWVVSEMIRTGLLRHVIQHGQHHLVPALVHLKGPDGWSACHFTGEDLGPMRSRLVTDLSLVDCLECEAAVARGASRGL